MSTTIEKETGMLDVGTHCGFCRQIDFLPFHCKFCDGDFCADHRYKEAHHCRWLIENENEEDKTTSVKSSAAKDNGGKYFQSLLPEKGYLRVQSDATKKQSVSRHEKESSIRSKANKNTLDKLARFFKRCESSRGLLSKKSTKPTNKLIQLANLKKSALGDKAIPLANRVYIYCYVVDNEDEDDAKEHQLYVNKVWPIGRVLDYIAKQLNVRNQNNDFKVTPDQKLHLCKKDNQSGEYDCLASSDRVATSIKDLDIICLVRGKGGAEGLDL